MQIHSVGIDLGKTTFHLLALGAAGKVLVRKKFTQKQLLTYTAKLQKSLIGLEACTGAHFLGRALRKQGHDVRLISGQFLKPFVKSTRTTSWTLRPLPNPSSARTCALCPSRPTTSWICRRSTAFAIGGFRGVLP